MYNSANPTFAQCNVLLMISTPSGLTVHRLTADEYNGFQKSHGGGKGKRNKLDWNKIKARTEANFPTVQVAFYSREWNEGECIEEVTCHVFLVK